MKSYSQHQEDNWVHIYCHNRGIELPKRVIEIGACDGIHFSNSRLFIEKGFHAILVEPNDHYFPQLEKNYANKPNVKTVNCAVTDKIGKVGFKKKYEAIDCSCVVDKNYDYQVQSVTYQQLLKDANWIGKEVGIVSIDTEGFDTPILEQVLIHHQPTIIIIESNKPDERTKQVKLLCDEYDLIDVRSVNTIWIKKGIIKNCL